MDSGSKLGTAKVSQFCLIFFLKDDSILLFLVFSDLAQHPISKWDPDAVADWMSEIGLEMYSDRAKYSEFTGIKLIKSTDSDLDKVNESRN